MILDFNCDRKKVNKAPVGAKFYNLYLLRNNLNLSVPEAFCITDRNYDRDDLVKRIDRQKKYAVRSSSDHEDRKDGSAAGLFKTYLDQQGLEQIEASIKKCFDSVHRLEIDSYLQKKGKGNARVHVSVIIQEMVKPEEAGVLFTMNPVNGRAEYIVESTSGLAEQILDGTGTPERIYIEKGKVPENPVYASLLSSAAVIEDYFGQPQDVEWAWAESKLYILQTRPITIQRMIQDLSLHWTRANIGEILPLPLTPLSWDVFEKVIFSSYRYGYYSLSDRLFLNFVHLIPREWPKIKSPRLFSGYAYLNYETICLTFSFEPWVDQQILNIGLGFNLPAAANDRPMKLTTRLIRLIKKTAYQFELIFPWLSFERKGLSYVTKQLHMKQTGSLDQLLKNAAFAFGWHIAATARSFSTLGYLKTKFGDKFSPQTISEKLASYENHIFLKDIDTLVKSAHTNPKVQERIKKGELNHYQDWTDAGEFVELFNSFLETYGHRSDNEFELANKSWRDIPQLLGNVLLKTDEKVSRQSLEIKKPEGLYTKLLASFNLREDLKNVLVQEFRRLREYFVNRGELLSQKGILEKPEDIFFMQLNEVSEAEQHHLKSIKNLIKKRKNDHNTRRINKVPYAFYGEQLPQAELNLNAANRKLITGTACSAGKITARTVHIHTVQDENKLEKGDILVTYATNPGWTPLFARAGGILTEIGGMLSHTATIAREYQIPMITGIENITQIIPDGRRVTIDGSLGTVRLHSE